MHEDNYGRAANSTPAPSFSNLLAKSVAGIDISAVQPAVEPIHALLGRAVRERLRLNRSSGHFLDVIIPNGGRRTQRRLNIACIEEATLLRRMRPDPREAIRL